MTTPSPLATVWYTPSFSTSTTPQSFIPPPPSIPWGSLTPEDTHEFRTSLKWTGEREGTLGCAGRPPLLGGGPVEFDGKGDRWTPEELFIGSWELCLLLTAVAVTEKFRMPLRGWESETVGHLEKGEKYYSFTKLTCRARVTMPPDTPQEKFLKAMEVTKKACFVSNSLACEAEFLPGMIYGDGPAVGTLPEDVDDRGQKR